MRKIIVLAMITLDGVMQAPGGPEEDTSGGFEYGGWVAPHGDEVVNSEVQQELQAQADFLLGRRTFEIWENYWPNHAHIWPRINEGTKYVISNTRDNSDWQNSIFIKGIDDIRTLKASEGADIHVWGSTELLQLLFGNDLVDELRLKIYPLTLGKGKNLFGDGIIPAAFTLTESTVSSKGLIIAHYKRAGEVQTAAIQP